MVRFVTLIVAVTSLAAGARDSEQHHFRVLQSTNDTNVTTGTVDDPTDNATETSEPNAGSTTEPPTMEVNSTVPPIDLATVPELLSAESDLGRLYDIYRVSKFGESLCILCNYTLFAPTNDAFDAFNQELLGKLVTPEWERHLTELLRLHVTQPGAERVLSSDLEDGMILTMLNGDNITVGVDGGNVALTGEYFNATQVVQADIIADNGVMHKVDQVLVPAFATMDLVDVGALGFREYSILASLGELLNIRTLVGDDDFTVFAPTNTAFMELGNETLAYLFDPTNVENATRLLLNHATAGVLPSQYLEDGLTVNSEAGNQLVISVSDDGSLMVNDANVVGINLLANNGIVHGISKVLLGSYMPPVEENITATSVPTAAPGPSTPTATNSTPTATNSTPPATKKPSAAPGPPTVSSAKRTRTLALRMATSVCAIGAIAAMWH
jgi:uncharacterized surface protein with fasciclin (FAS1) repeats